MSARVLKHVFGDFRYLILGLAFAAVVFVIALWLPNFRLVWQIAASTSVPLATKIEILAGLVGSIATNFTLFSALSLVVIALLSGANVAIAVYRMKLRRQIIGQMRQPGLGMSLGGLGSGLLGVGCAACGTFVLGPVLSLAGVGGILTLLPFSGQEFAVLGIFLLGLSLYFTARRLGEPLACSAEASQSTHSSLPAERF